MIPFKEGYRGSLIASETATTAGIGASITSYPNSVCRLPRTLPFATVSSATCEMTGHRRRSATAAQSKRLAERVEPALGPERAENHFALAVRLLEAKGLLDRLHVEVVQRALARAVEPLRLRVDALLDGGVGHLFHADRDLHGQDSSFGRENRLAHKRLLGSRPSSSPSAPMVSHRTTARAILLLALFGLAAGTAAARPDPGPPAPPRGDRKS